MTVEIGGIWELGWSAPITEYDQWWSVMRSFGIETLNMVPITGIAKRGVSEYSSIQDMLDDKQDFTPVFVDENAKCELADFVHPDNALYVFGKANYSPFSHMALDRPSVRIDCKKTGMLWPHQALAIIMRDRG